MTLSLGYETVSEYGTRTMTGQIGYLTQPTKLVLRALLDESGPFWNYGLARHLGLNQVTVNNVLHRLGDAEWAAPSREESDSVVSRGGGHPRIYWKLTDEGRQAAIERLVEAEQRQARGRDIPDEVSSHSIGASQTEGLRESLKRALLMLEEMEGVRTAAVEAPPGSRSSFHGRSAAFEALARQFEHAAGRLTMQLDHFRAELAPEPSSDPVAALDL